MDELAVIQTLERWRETGEEQFLRKGLPWLEGWLPIRSPIRRALGDHEAEALRAEVIEELVAGKLKLTSQVLRPRAFSVAVFNNRIRDRLRRLAREANVQAPGMAERMTRRVHAQSPPPIDARMATAEQMQQVLEVMSGLRLDERAALLLHHAPDRLSDEDWAAVADRHPPPPPARPSDELERTEIAALLYPQIPESTAYERTGKLIQRTYKKLRRVLDAVDARVDEEAP